MTFRKQNSINSNSNGTKDPQEQNDQEFHQHKSWGDWVEIVARWVVDLFAIPVSFVTTILAQFLERGGSGNRILGAIGFWAGTLLSTDGIWQGLFQGTPLFPWFENEWIGWSGWLTLPFNLLFWISLAMSALIQIQESKTLRGKLPAEAKKEFEETQLYTLPQKPNNTIDLGRALWGDYKRAGMRQRNSGGLTALFFWLFDFCTTFAGRNPFRYTNPSMILACLFYNFATMCAGEIGYSIWKDSKK